MEQLIYQLLENKSIIIGISICIIIFIVMVLFIRRFSTQKLKQNSRQKSYHSKTVPSKKPTLNDCISADDIQFKVDTYQRNLEEELSKSKELINEAQKNGYIKANITWTKRFEQFTEVANTLYKNLEYENAKKLNMDKFHRYTSLHFRSMLLGNLAYDDYKAAQKVRDEISSLLVEIGKRNIKVTKSEKSKLYDTKDACVKTTKYLYERMIALQKQTGILRDKIRDECGVRGREWFNKLEHNKQKHL